MRKKLFGRQLSRSRKARIALFRSQIRALALVGKIKTTKAKAKAIQGEIDKLISLAKKESIAARRKILANLGNDRTTTDVLVTKIAPTFNGRTSGFTRITTLPPRRGDAAAMARLEWVEVITTEKAVKADKGKLGSQKTKKVVKQNENLSTDKQRG